MRKLISWTLALSAVLTMFSGAFILIGRAIPSPIDSFLSRNGCNGQPCWQGIIPGVTSAADASAILRKLPYVDSATLDIASAFIQWRWTAGFTWAQPNESIPDNHMIVFQGVVQSLNLAVVVPAGDIVRLYGAPKRLLIGTEFTSTQICPWESRLQYGAITMRYTVQSVCGSKGIPDLQMSTANGHYGLNVINDEVGLVLYNFPWSGFHSTRRYMQMSSGVQTPFAP